MRRAVYAACLNELEGWRQDEILKKNLSLLKPNEAQPKPEFLNMETFTTLLMMLRKYCSMALRFLSMFETFNLCLYMSLFILIQVDLL